MPKTKFLTGELATPFYKPEVSLADRIKTHLEDGWSLKGPMVRACASSTLWVQRVVK